MLTLTENASNVVKAIATQTVGTEEAGLRITSSGDTGEEFAVSAVEQPEPGDEVVDSDGAKVFLTEEASAVLTDKVLDAQVDSSGGVQFAIGTPAADVPEAGAPETGVPEAGAPETDGQAPQA